MPPSVLLGETDIPRVGARLKSYLYIVSWFYGYGGRVQSLLGFLRVPYFSYPGFTVVMPYELREPPEAACR